MHPHYFEDEKMNDYGDGFDANTQDIINFAMKKLHYGECKRDNVDIKNFQSQVRYTNTRFIHRSFNPTLVSRKTRKHPTKYY